MRALALVLALAACTTAPGGPIPQSAGLTPDARGLQPAGTDLRIDFGRAEPGVIATVSRLLGSDPSRIVTQPECGAGPVRAASWPGGLTLNFQEGDFRGWVVDAPGQPVAGGLQVGQMPPNLPLQSTSLGREFSQAGVFGLVEDAGRVTTLWSGTTCFFR
ncbi:MAG: hypothetical protein CMH66_05530 [Nioella sp.]|nr:hypothetical protein [Nioella sp.]